MRLKTPDNSATLHALFPTLVYHAEMKTSPQYADALRLAEEKFSFRVEGSEESRHFAGEYHGQILVHHFEPLRPFFDDLVQHIAAFMKTLGMKTQFYDVSLLKTWFVFCDEGGDEDDALVTHNHSCSDISWVYYVDVPKDCPAVRFHAGGQAPSAPFESAFHYDWQDSDKSAITSNNWWNSETWSIVPKTGDLMVFPGHQLHSVDSNHTKERRVSLAGDVSLVLKPEYRNLEFGRTAPEHQLTLKFDDHAAE